MRRCGQERPRAQQPFDTILTLHILEQFKYRTDASLAVDDAGHLVVRAIIATSERVSADYVTIIMPRTSTN